jgi:branched-chain amino acid transport system ATP-binding protein
MSAAPMLDIQNLSAGYGSALVLHGVNLRVGAGEMVALVGANGAGKTTLLKTISGLLTPRNGTIAMDGNALAGRSQVARVKMGLAHVPEGRQIFGDLTVEENLEIGAYTQLRALPREEYASRVAEVYRLFPILSEKKDLAAGGLSGGQQQMLAIGRGLMLKPTLLLLDEPSLGLSPLLVTEIFRILNSLRKTGVSILLSEQNARLSLAIADRGYVIETGKIVREGAGAELLASSDIMERYLGVGTSSIDLEHDPAKDELTRKLRAVVGSGSPA